MRAEEVVQIDVMVSQYTLRTTDGKVTVHINHYADGWHVEGTPPDCIWDDADDAMAVASHLVRELHKAKKLDAEAEAIRQGAVEYAMTGRTARAI